MNKTNRNKNIYFMACSALFAAIMCVLGPLSLPIGPVPISLTNLVVYLSIFLLGPWAATVSTIIYILLGAFGLPVFSNGQGGLAKLVGPTGGYIVAYILVALIGGLCLMLSKGKLKYIITVLGLIVGTAILYLIGTLWFMYVTKSGMMAALELCVFPFIVLDLIKIVIATILGIAVRRALAKANLLFV